MIEKLVLLVEDNENDVALTERAFKKCKVPARMEVAYDGTKALDFLFPLNGDASLIQFHEPDLVVLDLKMPRVGGFEVLREIRAHPRTVSLPVIILTSSSEEKDRAECRRLGATGYFSKPVEFDQFLRLVEQIKSVWLANCDES